MTRALVVPVSSTPSEDAPGVNFAIGATTLTLLIVLPLPVYVAIKQLVAWTIMGVGIAITIDRSVRTARQTGFAVEAPVRRIAASST